MKEYFTKSYSAIKEIGVTKHLSKVEEKRIRLLNIFCSNWLVLEVIFMIDDFFSLEDPSLSLLTHGGIVLCIIFSIFLQKKREYDAARLFFLGTTLAEAFMFANFIEQGNLIEYFYLLVPPFMLLFTNKNTILYPTFIVSILLFIVPNEFLHHYPDGRFGSKVLILALFFMVFLLVDYFKKSNLKSEEELEKKRSELEKLNAFQSQFFINVSHEVRTPLTLMKGQIDKLKDKNNNGDLEFKNIEKGLTLQVEKIKKIVDDVLDLAKMKDMNFQLEKKQTDFSDLVSRLSISFEPLFNQKKIDFEVHLSNVLYYVPADDSFLERALNNLLINALKYTPKGGKVEVWMRAENESVSLFIKDTGIGISKSDLEKICDRFYQVDNDTNKAGGSGVGLAFTKEIISLHDGNLTITSKLNKGSVFKVELPLVSTQKRKVEIELQEDTNEEITPVEIDESLYRLLIVDDNYEMREYLKDILSEFNCVTAEDGIEALKILESEKIHFLITDYMMPNMNGYDLIKELNVRKYDIPVLMLTARTDSKSKLDSLRLGIDDYLNKPFEKEELLIRIKNALNNHLIKVDYRIEENITEEEPVVEATWVEEVKQYVSETCGKLSLTQEDIAVEFNLSKSSLYRKIKSDTGLTPNEFITEVKLQKARILIEEVPDISLKRLALEVGFSHSSYFSKIYQKRFGVKPILNSSK